jgi:hypothetical protein
MLGIAICVVTTVATTFDMTVDTGRKTIAIELLVATTNNNNGNKKTLEAY